MDFKLLYSIGLDEPAIMKLFGAVNHDNINQQLRRGPVLQTILQSHQRLQKSILLIAMLKGTTIFHKLDRRNLLGFVLPISSHVTILLGSFGIILLVAFMAQLCLARKMLEKSKEILSRDWSHDFKWVKTNLSRFCLFKPLLMHTRQQ